MRSMNEVADPAPVPAAAPSAGRLLREARERQGLHIAALAASIKVTPKKLEMLEADRFDAFPDVTFTRALAQAVCRVLKIDSAPVLRLLPPLAGHRLEHVGEGLNAPFRERPGALVQRDGSTLSPVFWVTALILFAAIGLYFVPPGTLGMPHWRGHGAASAVEPSGTVTESPSAPVGAAGASDAAGSAPSGSEAGTTTRFAAALPPAEPAIGAIAKPGALPALVATPTEAADAASSLIQFRTTAASWLEVTDARGRSLVARLVQPGETLDVGGVAPFRVRIGNASGTRVSFRGQPMELAAYTHDNVARLELK
jgi:cytoskeleton protein RodZ